MPRSAVLARLAAFVLSLAFATGAPAADPGDALREAARAGDAKAVAAQLAAGTPVDSPGRHGTTALILAAGQGHLAVVRLLVERGADVNRAETFFGATPLAMAVGGKHREVMLHLLAHGVVDPTPALEAGVEGKDVELVRAALATGRVEPLDLAVARRFAAESSEEVREALAAATAIRPERAPYTPPADRLQRYVGRLRGGEREGTVELAGPESKGVVLRLGESEPLLLLPIAPDRFETAAGDARLDFAGRAGLVEWATLIRDGEVTSFSLLTTPDPTPLAAVTPAGAAIAVGAGATATADRQPPRPWPQFRGGGAAGNGDGQGAPLAWDLQTGKNVRFKTPVPGLALSSPIVWGDRIFLTTAVSAAGDATFRTGLYGDPDSVDDRSSHSFRLYALDAKSGAVRWEREVLRGAPTVRRHLKSSLANATPATDGERVVVLFGAVGVLAAYDFDGRQLWRRDVGVLDANDPQAGVAEWGHASSPILWRDLVIVQADRRRDSFLAAFKLATGAPVWRVDRPEPSTWSTPNVLAGPAGDELVTNGTTIRGYDPATGRELWRLGPNSEVVVGSPVVGDGVAYVVGGYPPVRPVYAVRAGQRGDLSLPAGATASAAIAWSYPRGGSYVPTPLVYRGHLYTLNNNGVLTVYRAADGVEVHRARVAPSGTAFSASPIAADGRLYLASETGEVLVLRAAPDLGLIVQNDMDEVVMATPAVADGLLVVRTLGHVVGLAEAASPPAR